ncbi:NAD-dependent epimerase/dehydratase family protein [Streptomyces tanashiensis]|uniref:NAD-dependent epimerase/dehydratase family protein n=1 Tax=Streptomyces tanashiensis TaxID=67367 RepID=UPI00167ECA5A|nr:NAD-dependent epimerase/dehydratase family protein [Streptomyces tanashiensis]GGY34350.1 epimerase [Streptomyces tanashiensis]
MTQYEGRIVVTGGGGFVGSHLCERLLLEGFAVVCVDDFSTGSVRNVEPLARHSGFQVLRADVTAGLEISGAVDAVLHLASPASPVAYLSRPLETMHVGSTGTQHALDLACSKEARFLLASTSEVYGDPQVHPQPESYWGHVNPVGPRAVYDEAKRFSEALTVAHRDARGLDARIVRIFNTFGPHMRADDGRMIPNFIRQALAGEALTVAGDGSQTRSLCYVSDTVEGILRLLWAQDEQGPVNIGGTHEMTVLATAELICGLVGSSSAIEFVARPQDDPAVRRPDISKAEQSLGWRPAVSIEAGIKKTIDWFLEDSLLIGS